MVGLNARERKEQSLAYGRKKAQSISRIPDEPRIRVALGPMACPGHSIGGNWAQKVDDTFFGGWKITNAKLRTLLVFIDIGKVFAGVQRGI